MTAWFRKKPRLTPQGQYPPEITRAIHTMADDLAGKAKVEASHEPLVAFQPGQTGEAAFYAAPAIQEPIATASMTESSAAPSPFLVETAPLPAQGDQSPVESPIPVEEAALIDQMQELERSIPVPVQPLPEGAIPVTAHPLTFVERLKRHKRGIGIGIGIGILVLAGSGGFWYWWQSRMKETTPMISETLIQETTPIVDVQVREPEPEAVQHYSPTQPNLLSFNTETVTAEMITTEFLQVARVIEQDTIRQPVEFLVRDQNYNPLAFSRFVYLLGLALPPELLSTLDEEFSLFVVLDQDRPRMGLVVKIRDKAAFQDAMNASETLLPKVMEPFYLDTTTAPKTNLVFRSGLYQEQLVRFVNIDPAMNLTLDYAVREQQWFLGTSQMTLRAMLDRSLP